MAKPIPISEINPNTLVELNTTLEEMWDILNGRYNIDVETSVPTVGSEGDIKAYYTGATYKLYVYINGGWRAFSSD